MTFTFGWALAILVVMYYVSSVLSTKTRARIGTMIFFSVFILIGYWTIFPADIIATSQIPVVAAITNLVLLINVGSSFDLATLKQDWRVVVVTLVGCLGMGVLVFATVTPVFGLDMAISSYPCLVGGLVATNLVNETLMNKGLEVIEASRLFDVPPSRIDVTVHPQSIVHSMVEFRDGATIAQASPPDMRLPIALGLSAPERLGNVAAACDWTKAATWTFEPLDNEAFPAVNLARHCLESSEKHTAVLNAANEQAVHAFLEHRLPYLGIVDTVREVLDEMDAELRGNPLFASVEEMSRLEQEARARADKLINK